MRGVNQTTPTDKSTAIKEKVTERIEFDPNFSTLDDDVEMSTFVNT